MYKFLLLSLIFIGQISMAQEPVTPKWTDFCEPGYENAVYKKYDDVLNIFSFVKTERVKKNYWAQRRQAFEQNLKTCEELDDLAKDFCYTELINSEDQKNDLYKLKRKEIIYENNIKRY